MPELAGLSAEAVATFATLMEDLGSIRGLQGEIAKQLDDFAAILEGTPSSGEGILALPDHLRAMRSGLACLAEATQERVTGDDPAAACSAVSILARCGRTLSAVATLSRTTAAAAGIGTLDRYLDALAATGNEIGQAAQEVQGDLDWLVIRATSTLEQCRNGTRALDRLTPHIERRVAELGRMTAEDRRRAIELADSARSCGTQGRAMLRGFISAMQFSDRLAQRLDHVARILSHDDSRLHRLAAAQLESLAGDVASVVEDVRMTMDGVARLADEGARLLNTAEVAASARASLEARAGLVDTALTELAPLRDLVASAEGEARHVRDTADTAGAAFRRLSVRARDLSHHSINATLVAARSGDARGPLSALSSEVRSVAARALDAVCEGEQRMGAIAQMAAGAEATVSDAGGGLRGALDAARAEAERDAERLPRIEAAARAATDAADRLRLLLSRGRERLSGLADTGADIAGLAQHLAARAPEPPPDTATLSDIFAMYTMEEERAVHRDVCPASAEPSAQSHADGATADAALAERAPADGDDIDALLF